MNRAVADVMTEAVVHVDPTSPLTRVLRADGESQNSELPGAEH